MLKWCLGERWAEPTLRKRVLTVFTGKLLRLVRIRYDLIPRRRLPLGVDLVLIKLLLTEVHDVRPAEVFLVEVHREGRSQLLPVPGVGFEELFVGVALFVPVGQQGRGEIDP